MPERAILVKDLHKRFGPVVALESLSFDADRGDIVGLLGPNGAGKTTALRILSTALAADSGTVELLGYDLSESADAVRSLLGFVPETPPLLGELTVAEYLQHVAEMRGLSRAQRKTELASVNSLCGIEEVQKRLCRNLSRGFRQRVGLAQAILHKPQLLLLDEPTNGLDPQQIQELRTLLRDLSSACTVLISTHVLSEVTAVANRIVIIGGGRTLRAGLLDELTKATPLEKVFLEALQTSKRHNADLAPREQGAQHD